MGKNRKPLKPIATQSMQINNTFLGGCIAYKILMNFVQKRLFVLDVCTFEFFTVLVLDPCDLFDCELVFLQVEA